MKKNTSIVIIVLAAVLVLCCCVIVILGAVYYSFTRIQTALPTISANLPTLPNSSSSSPSPTPFQITRQPVDQIPTATLKLLEGLNVPENDLVALACRFKNVCNVPPTLAAPPQPYALGAQETFWANNEDTNTYFKVKTTLRYITPHSYFWVADNVKYNQNEVKKLMDAFENKIYPTDREFFGSEWTPGVDDDPHLYIVYVQDLGSTVGGYFSSANEYNPQVRQYSNAHEMFFFPANNASLSADYTYGTLAHEFQHMIHWNQDRNETSFLNEGLSELASFLNGYSTGGGDQLYTSSPDINLTDWIAGTAGDNSVHYGASYLFVTYFLDRFGEETTKALIRNQQNGLDSLDGTLAQSNIKDPDTGKVVTADDFFLDWAITNFVQDASVGDGRYYYHNYPTAPKADPTEAVSTCPANTSTRTVNQYGVDYIRLDCRGNYSLTFEGQTSTRLLPADPHSGSYAFWSNKGDESDMSLTHSFDLSKVSGPVKMNYWTWYDIEKDYDYAYVEASTDDQHWEILTTPSGTSSNPNGASLGWAYNGQSNGWLQESVDLSKYDGQKVAVRFEYLTDEAVNGEGLLIDDVTVPALNYTTGFESDDSSWQSAGFARIENTVPQTFRLALIIHASGGTTVQIIPVSADQSATIPLTVGQNGILDEVLVVSGTTRFTRVVATYQFNIH